MIVPHTGFDKKGLPVFVKNDEVIDPTLVESITEISCQFDPTSKDSTDPFSALDQRKWLKEGTSQGSCCAIF